MLERVERRRHDLSSVFVTPSAEKYVHIVLATEAREGSITQVTAVCLMVATGHLFEDTLSTCRHQGVSTSGSHVNSGRNMVPNFIGATSAVCSPVTHGIASKYYQEDESMLRHSLENLGCSRSAEKHV